jgi:hypothetical protein
MGEAVCGNAGDKEDYDEEADTAAADGFVDNAT